MENIELLTRAKQYIEDLANGRDPIGGGELPGDTVLNNVRLARCFFYVSGVLQKVIDNGGVVGRGAPKEKKAPFAITREEIDTVQVTDAPTYISHFCRRLGDAAGVGQKNMKQLSHRVITDWLVEKGFLCVEERNGKKVKCVTALGQGIGLANIEREGQFGKYVAIEYNKEAQQFLLDNLEGILEMNYTNPI